jgi:hypothetical protein
LWSSALQSLISGQRLRGGLAKIKRLMSKNKNTRENDKQNSLFRG